MQPTPMKRRSAALLALLLGAAVLAGCQNPGDPFGYIDDMRVTGSSVNLLGWVFDTSNPADPVEIHVYVDGVGRGAFRADAARPDVQNAWEETFEGMGPDHGFNASVNIAENGSHEVCVYAINIGAGKANTNLGCRTVTTFGYSPFGSVDQIVDDSAAGTLRLVGWAKDPESAESLKVQVTEDGRFLGTYNANVARPDVAAVVPDAGPNHGFNITLQRAALTEGSRLCVYGVNVGPTGGNSLIGCKRRNIDTTIVYGIEVATSIAHNVKALIELAATKGLTLTGEGFRSPEEQIAFRRQNCGTSHYAIYEMPAGACSPPTARPGTSMHEKGLAIDFRCNGQGMGSRSSPCFSFLSQHAATYGLYNLPSEPWHWSTNGR